MSTMSLAAGTQAQAAAAAATAAAVAKTAGAKANRAADVAAAVARRHKLFRPVPKGTNIVGSGGAPSSAGSLPMARPRLANDSRSGTRLNPFVPFEAAAHVRCRAHVLLCFVF